jgi:hypothetical protein
MVVSAQILMSRDGCGHVVQSVLRTSRYRAATTTTLSGAVVAAATSYSLAHLWRRATVCLSGLAAQSLACTLALVPFQSRACAAGPDASFIEVRDVRWRS